MTRFLATTVLLSIANLSFSAGWLQGSKITGISFYPEGVLLSGNWNNPNECDSYNAVLLEDKDSNYDKAFSAILAAYMAGKTVRGYSNYCVNVDGTTYNMIRGYKYLSISN